MITVLCHVGKRRRLSVTYVTPDSNFRFSAALHHPNFWKNFLEAADALRLIAELGWPIPPSFEDTLIHALTNLTATTPSIVDHTLCAILRELGEHMSIPSYVECCIHVCTKHTDALILIADRHANDSRKVDNSVLLAVPQFVSKVLEGCPSLIEVVQHNPDKIQAHSAHGCPQKLKLPENIDKLSNLQKVCGRTPK